MAAHAQEDHNPPTERPPQPSSREKVRHKTVQEHEITKRNRPVDEINIDDLEIEHQHIWIITGPSGCGKTSVAEHLHHAFAMPYLEGDSFHTPENVAKMAAGNPLTDADRWDWLITLREKAIETLSSTNTSTKIENHNDSQPHNPHRSVIVTCSALKQKYRDVLRIAPYFHSSIRLHFIFLQASEELLIDRVHQRKGHYMKDHMVHSQFETLEMPAEDETDVLNVDASGTPDEVQKAAEETVKKVLKADAVSS